MASTGECAVLHRRDDAMRCGAKGTSTHVDARCLLLHALIRRSHNAANVRVRALARRFWPSSDDSVMQQFVCHRHELLTAVCASESTESTESRFDAARRLPTH